MTHTTAAEQDKAKPVARRVRDTNTWPPPPCVVRRLAQVHPRPWPRGDRPGASAGLQRCDVKLHATSARYKLGRFFPFSERGAAAAAALRPLRLIARVAGGERRQHRQQVQVGLAEA